MTFVIGLGHTARSGKDTACAAIIAARGGEFDIRRYAFADELKREMNEAVMNSPSQSMYGLYQYLIRRYPDADLEFDFEADKTDPLCPLGKQRSLLQWWGTDFRRAQDAFYWVKRVKARIEADKPQFAIITDMRFLNEFAYVVSTGGATVRVTRENNTVTDLALRQHATETDLERVIFDYEISVAEGGVEELKRDAVGVFDSITDALRNPTDFTADEVVCAT